MHDIEVLWIIGFVRLAPVYMASLVGSRTIYLSLGDRPVCTLSALPVDRYERSYLRGVEPPARTMRIPIGPVHVSLGMNAMCVQPNMPLPLPMWSVIVVTPR